MDDRELLARFVDDGSHGAFDELVRRHTPLVYAVCRRVLDDDHAAEDAAQAAFMVLMRKAPVLVHAAAGRALGGWLHVTARQAALQLRRAITRRHRREREAAQAAGETAPDPRVADALRGQLDAALAALSNAQRSALLLRYVQGLSQEEAARVLGCGSETVHTHVTRALAKLRALLGRAGLEVSTGVVIGALAAPSAPPAVVAAIHGACLSHGASAAATHAAAGVMKAAVWAKAMGVAAVAAAGIAAAAVMAAALLHRPPATTAAAPTPVASFTGHSGGIAAIAFLSDGTVASGSWDRSLRIWRADGTAVAEGESHGDGLHGLAVADGVLLSASSDGTAVRWSADPLKPILTLKGHEGRVLCAALSRDGARAATGGLDATVRLWARDGSPGPVMRHRDSVWGLAFSPDGRTLAAAGDDHLAVLWDAATGARLGEFAGHTDCLRCVAFSPDGALLATGGNDRTARIWRVADRAQERLLQHRGMVWAVAFSPDGGLLATGGDDGARLWDARSGEDRGGPGAAAGKLNGVAFSPDGSLLATGGDDGIGRVWRIADVITH